MIPDDRDPLRNSTGESLPAVLRHRHRRWALKCLARANDSLHLADLARDVARVELPRQGEPAVLEEAVALRTRLYHNHVPRLREAGIVSFDRETRLVSLTADPDSVLSSVEHAIDPLVLDGRN